MIRRKIYFETIWYSLIFAVTTLYLSMLTFAFMNIVILVMLKIYLSVTHLLLPVWILTQSTTANENKSTCNGYPRLHPNHKRFFSIETYFMLFWVCFRLSRGYKSPRYLEELEPPVQWRLEKKIRMVGGGSRWSSNGFEWKNQENI